MPFSPLRLKGHEYIGGTYFVTICLQPRRRLLGTVADHSVRLSPLGEVVADALDEISLHFDDVWVDSDVVMPDHVHMLVVVPGHGRAMASLSTIVGSFKSAAAKRANALRRTPGAPFWQRSFYEHIVRDEADLDRCREYIARNPARWMERQRNGAPAQRP